MPAEKNESPGDMGKQERVTGHLAKMAMAWALSIEINRKSFGSNYTYLLKTPNPSQPADILFTVANLKQTLGLLLWDTSLWEA